MSRTTFRVALRVAVATLLTVSVAVVGSPFAAHADTAAQTLPFTQNWANTGLITTSDDWSGVPGITGYRGDGLTATTAVDPQTVLGDGTLVVDVNANQTNPNTFTTGGVSEFDTLADPVVALQGSGTARAPSLVMFLNTTGQSNIQVSYNLRDIDGSTDNSVQPVALQYRVGSSGSYTNLPSGFVADASTGPSLATLVTPVSVTLPAAAENQPLVNLRVITTDAVGSDEWIGVDDISVTTGDTAPSVSGTTPNNSASNVATNSNITVSFSESVHVTSTWLTVSGSSSGSHTYTYDSSPSAQTDASTWIANPDTDFANGETVTVTVVATQVGDTDATDPPENMAADYGFSFQVIPADLAPSVSSTNPANNAGQVPDNSNFDVTFSEPVTLSAGAFTVSGSSSGAHAFVVSGGPTTYTVDPTTDFNDGELVTVTVVASQVSDNDAQDPPDNMAADYTFKFGTPIRIHDVQGATHISPYNGQTVLGVPGIVTAKRSNGFYLQDPAPDADEATSEGIFVFTSSAPSVNVGDAISVSGSVTEFRAGGAASASLTNTEIQNPGLSIAVNSTGNPLPSAVVVGAGGRLPPTQQIEDDASGSVETGGVFDPATDGIDFWESLEFMRVQLNDAHVVGPTSDFGSNREVPVVGDNGANATIITPRGGILLRQTDNNPERIILNDVITGGPTLATTVDVGDSYPGPTIGEIDYNFNNFKLEVTSIPPLLSGGITQEITPALAAGQLSVASFNLENLDPGDPPSKFQDLANEVVTNLRSPDLIGLEEVQDNNGATDNGVVDASTTLNMFIAAIQAAGGPAYDFREIDPVNDQDGGEPGGNIRVAFLFRTDRGLSFVDRPGGTSTAANAVLNVGGAPQLLYSPGRVDPANSAWNSSRKPLAAEFMYGGSKLFVIVNHFNSKGGDQPLWGRFQPPTLVSEVQRDQQAQLVHDFTNSIEAIDPSANVIVLGDLNDFSWSNPLQTLTAGGVLDDLVLTLPQDQQYSYVFEGNTQELDHLLASPAMAGQMALYDPVHINAEFAPQVSDHDPLVALFAMTPPLNCTVSGGAGNQTMNGTPGPDHICGNGGNDTIDGKGGNDIIDGGPGDDTILGGSGEDQLLGKKGVDTITGGPGSDQIKGGYGNDVLNSSDGVQGNDSTDGGKGNDSCTADPGDVTQHCP